MGAQGPLNPLPAFLIPTNSSLDFPQLFSCSCHEPPPPRPSPGPPLPRHIPTRLSHRTPAAHLP